MSFEYYGAFKTLNFLLENGATKDQAEAVSEAIVRHADLGETGMLTSLGMLIQLSTVFGKSLVPFARCVVSCTARSSQVGPHDRKRRGPTDCEVLQAYLSGSRFIVQEFPSYCARK
jgi:hypothetical protein